LDNKVFDVRDLFHHPTEMKVVLKLWI